MGTTQLNSRFKGLSTAKTWGSSQYITPGQYLLRLKEIKTHDTVDPGKGNATFFFATFDVMVATYSEEQEKKFSEGDELTWSINMSHASAQNNLIQFLLALCKKENFTQEQLTDDFIATIFDPNFRFLGTEMVANAFNTKTKTGGDFTAVKWMLYVPEDAPAEEDAAQA